MCRLVGSTEPLRQSIFPLTDSSSLDKPTTSSWVQAFPAHLLLTSAFQPTQTFLLQKRHCRHLNIAVCFDLCMHFPQIHINMEQGSSGGQDLSRCCFYSMFIWYFQQRLSEHFATCSVIAVTGRLTVAGTGKVTAPSVPRMARRQPGNPDAQHITQQLRVQQLLGCTLCSEMQAAFVRCCLPSTHFPQDKALLFVVGLGHDF